MRDLRKCGVSGTPRTFFSFSALHAGIHASQLMQALFIFEYSSSEIANSCASGVYFCLFSWFSLLWMVNLLTFFHYILLSIKRLDINDKWIIITLHRKISQTLPKLTLLSVTQTVVWWKWTKNRNLQTPLSLIFFIYREKRW